MDNFITREEFLRVSNIYFSSRFSVHRKERMLSIALGRFDDAVKNGDYSLVKNIFETMRDYSTNKVSPTMELT